MYQLDTLSYNSRLQIQTLDLMDKLFTNLRIVQFPNMETYLALMKGLEICLQKEQLISKKEPLTIFLSWHWIEDQTLCQHMYGY